MSQLIESQARQSMQRLEPDSVCAKALKCIDIDKCLAEDIERICAHMSMGTMSKIMSLGAKLKFATGEKAAALREELKDVAIKDIECLEAETGALHLPSPCRHLLLSL